MDLVQLRLFKQVAEFGSLSKVAMLLNKAQSFISRQIGLLEQDCGGRLFYRTGRGMVLTELGLRVYPRAQALLAEADGILSEARGAAHDVAGEVSLGLIPSLGRSIAGPLFFRALAQFPGVQIKFIEAFSGELDAWLESGMIGVAVLLRSGTILRPEEQRLQTWQTHLIGPIGDPLTAEAQTDFVQLAGLPLIVPGAPSGARLQIERLSQQAGIVLSIAAEVNSSQITLELVRSGAGYSLSPATPPLALMAEEVRLGRLQASLIVNPSVERTLALTVTPNRARTRAEDAVIMLLKQIVAELLECGSETPSAVTDSDTALLQAAP